MILRRIEDYGIIYKKEFFRFKYSLGEFPRGLNIICQIKTEWMVGNSCHLA